jgi:hypothetical protein
VFQYWRTKRVFAQKHGAGLEAWQTRTRRGDSDSVNLGSNPDPPASYYVRDIAYIIVFLGSLF